MSVTDCQDDMLGGSGGLGSGMAGVHTDGGGGGSGRGRGTGKVKNADRKSARARTVLSEKQLNILKTCYSANPRPDALMKEQLTEMTGLSPRVVRVWFQNKRCKDKKLQIRASEKQLQRDAVSEGIDHEFETSVKRSTARWDPFLSIDSGIVLWMKEICFILQLCLLFVLLILRLTPAHR